MMFLQDSHLQECIRNQILGVPYILWLKMLHYVNIIDHVLQISTSLLLVLVSSPSSNEFFLFSLLFRLSMLDLSDVFADCL
ncbi:hypothetical protein H5410_016709 [Solanum commersonii]|uniref:Uncharacterized protein n=1 Tax=Solanum commersonii TaxID=4109 RepID=A0A9J5ZX05_SOLCO|nr:hypothetical protein H5410_016709 [Solanum commersonii]